MDRSKSLLYKNHQIIISVIYALINVWSIHASYLLNKNDFNLKIKWYNAQYVNEISMSHSLSLSLFSLSLFLSLSLSLFLCLSVSLSLSLSLSLFLSLSLSLSFFLSPSLQSPLLWSTTVFQVVNRQHWSCTHRRAITTIYMHMAVCMRI